METMTKGMGVDVRSSVVKERRSGGILACEAETVLRRSVETDVSGFAFFTRF